MNVTNESEAVALLRIIKDRVGRNYKRAISLAWQNGNYRKDGLEDWAGNLQRIRNAFGPSWLYRQ